MLTRASLRYYAATNVLVVLGVAVAVAVLGGALLVGASVRESLQQIALGRLGATDVDRHVADIFSDRAGRRHRREPGTGAGDPAVAPLIVAGGAVSHEESKRSAGRVMVYGIDERFGRFHGVDGFTITGREALISERAGSRAWREGRRLDHAARREAHRHSAVVAAGPPGNHRRAHPPDGRARARSSVARRVLARAVAGTGAGDLRADGPPAARPRPRRSREHAAGEQGSGPAILTLRSDRAPSLTLDDLGLRTRRGPTGDTIVESRAGLITDALADADRRNCQSRSPLGRRRCSPMSPMRSASAIARSPTRPSRRSIRPKLQTGDK